MRATTSFGDGTASDRHLLDADGLGVEFRLSAATNATLVMANDTRLAIEQWPQAIASKGRIARLPISFEELPSLLNGRR